MNKDTERKIKFGMAAGAIGVGVVTVGGLAINKNNIDQEALNVMNAAKASETHSITLTATTDIGGTVTAEFDKAQTVVAETSTAMGEIIQTINARTTNIAGTEAAFGTIFAGQTETASAPTVTLVPPSETPTLEPTLIPTPSEAPTVVVQVPTPTMPPTETPTSVPTETATPTKNPVDNGEPWTGELPYNQFRANGQNGEQLFETEKQLLVNEFGYKTQLGRVDSALTSITNPFSLRGSITDPLNEAGLGHTDSSIKGYEYLTPDDFDKKINDLLTDVANNHGQHLTTFGIVAPSHDRDASVTMAAILKIASQNRAYRNATPRTMMNDPYTKRLIEAEKNKIYSGIQKEFTGTSEEEADRRSNSNSGDMSAKLPKDLQDPNGYVSCDVYRPEAIAIGRNDQMQSLRQVNHWEDNLNTFQTSDHADNVWILGSWSNDTNQSAVRAFTDRGYIDPEGQDGNYNNSAALEQELPCGVGKAVNSTPTPVLNQPVITPDQPGKTPESTVTYSPGQTPVATATGIGGTPIVETPVNTPKPTEQVAPTIPVGASATPSF